MTILGVAFHFRYLFKEKLFNFLAPSLSLVPSSLVEAEVKITSNIKYKFKRYKLVRKLHA